VGDAGLLNWTETNLRTNNQPPPLPPLRKLHSGERLQCCSTTLHESGEEAFERIPNISGWHSKAHWTGQRTSLDTLGSVRPGFHQRQLKSGHVCTAPQFGRIRSLLFNSLENHHDFRKLGHFSVQLPF
jgi:hypothetical protein